MGSHRETEGGGVYCRDDVGGKHAHAEKENIEIRLVQCGPVDMASRARAAVYQAEVRRIRGRDRYGECLEHTNSTQQPTAARRPITA